MRFISFATTLFCCLSSFIFNNEAVAKRIALVIGNDNYLAVTKLEKAIGDAKAVGAKLSSLGFKVILHKDLKSREMNRQIYSNFIRQIQKGDEVLFYYAGHGIEIRSRNYLLATDIPKVKPGNERFVTKEAFAVDEIIAAIQEREARLAILILDACRDNPFPKQGTRSIGTSRGLGRSDPPKGTFVMYSAGSRQAALDRLDNNDHNPNSIYTRKLLPLLKSPGLKLTEMAKQLRGEVEELASSVNHNQYPAYYDQMRGEFYFSPGKLNAKKSSQKIEVLKTDKNREKISALQQHLVDLEAKLKQQEKISHNKSPPIIPKRKTTPKLNSSGVSVAEHVEFIHTYYKHVGLSQKGIYRSTFNSCTGCVPLILYCSKNILRLSDLKGLRVVGNKGSRPHLQKIKGIKLMLLPFSEVLTAMKSGIITCKATGGGKPKYAVNGPLPKGFKTMKLPRSGLH